MPILPSYDSSNNINTTLGPQRDQAAQPFKDNAQVIGTLQDITQKLSDAHDVMQETRKKTATETSLFTLKQQAQNDPNPDNAESYIKQAQAISDKGAEGIDNQEIAGQVKDDIAHSSFLTQIKIQDMFKAKQMLATKEAQQQANVVAAQNIASPVSEAAAVNDYDNNMAQIRKLHATGVYSDAEALGAEKEFKTEIVKARISKNTSTNPDDYKGIDNGMGLDIKETSEMQKMVAAHIKEVDQANIKNTLNNRISTINGIVSGQFDWKNADQISKVAIKDPDLGEALQSVFNSEANKQPYQPENDQDQNFSDLVGSIYSQGTKQDISDFTTEVLKSHGNKEISRDRLAILVDAAEKIAQGLPTNKESGDGKDDQQQNVIGSTIKGIKDFFKGTADAGQKAGSVLTNFFKNLTGGVSPQQAKEEAMKTFNVKQYSWIATLPKEGAIKVDKNGNKVRIYPDGHYEDVK